MLFLWLRSFTSTADTRRVAHACCTNCCFRNIANNRSAIFFSSNANGKHRSAECILEHRKSAKSFGIESMARARELVNSLAVSCRFGDVHSILLYILSEILRRYYNNVMHLFTNFFVYREHSYIPRTEG